MLSTPDNCEQLPINSEQPASTYCSISSIVNPATFAYQGRLYQAIKWTPRHRISSATSIPATRTMAKIPISTRTPLSPNSKVAGHNSKQPSSPAKRSDPIPSQEQAPSDSSSDSAPISSPTTRSPSPVSATLSAVHISSSQPSDTPSEPPSTLATPLPSIFALEILREPSPSSTTLFPTHFVHSDVFFAIPSILRYSVRFLLRSRLRYIRKHARLKGMLCNVQLL
jgi:hypothetical protein